MFNEKSEKERAAIYIRVSTKESSSKWASTWAQKKAILDYIKRHNDKYIINKNTNIYVDDWYSWATDDRPAFKRLMKNAENNKFDIVFVWKIDRFFRKILHLLWYIENLDDLWIKFKSVTQDFTTDWPFWKSILWILWIIAELERDLIKERTMLWRTTKAEKWCHVWWWPVSLWYDKYETELWKKLKINEEEAELVRRIFDLFVNEKKSINEIARIFTNERILTKYNKINFSDETKKKRKMKIWIWYTQNVSSIIQNTIYIWKYYFWMTWSKIDKETKKTVKYDKPKSEWFEFESPRIIEDKLFNDAQLLVYKNRFTKNNKISHEFAWLIICKDCWKHYIWEKTTKWTISYRCWGKKKDKNPEWITCKNKQVSELILIDLIWNKIEKLFKNPKEVLEAYYDRWLEENTRIKALRNEENILNENIEKNEETFSSMQEDYYSLKGIRKENLNRLMSQYETKITDYYKRLEEVKVRIEDFNRVKENSNNLIKLIKNYKNIFSNLTKEDKINIIKEFVEKIEVDWININVLFKFSIKKKWKWWWKWKKIIDKVGDYTKEVWKKLDNGINAVLWNTNIRY